MDFEWTNFDGLMWFNIMFIYTNNMDLDQFGCGFIWFNKQIDPTLLCFQYRSHSMPAMGACQEKNAEATAQWHTSVSGSASLSLVVLPTSLNDSIQYDVAVYIRYHILNPTVHYFVRIYDIYNMIFREFWSKLPWKFRLPIELSWNIDVDMLLLFWSFPLVINNYTSSHGKWCSNRHYLTVEPQEPEP